jgi:hypothetical protein
MFKTESFLLTAPTVRTGDVNCSIILIATLAVITEAGCVRIDRPTKYFFIMSDLNGFVISIEGARGLPGTPLTMYRRKTTNNDHQLWFEDWHSIIRSKLDECLVFDQNDSMLVISL